MYAESYNMKKNNQSQVQEKDAGGKKMRKQTPVESEHHYRLFVEQSPNCVAIHSEGKIVYINPSGIKLLGAASEKEILGKTAIDFIHPDDRAAVAGRIGKAVREGTTAPLSEERFVLPDGRIIYADVMGIPITYQGKPAMEVIIRDISDRKAAEKTLKSSDAMLSAFLEYMPALILIKDHELRPVFANGLYRKKFPVDQWLGKKPHELFPAEVADLMVTKDKEALTAGYTSYEETWVDIEGTSRVYFTEKFRIDVPDGPPLLGSIITDVTDKKEAAHALMESKEIFTQFMERSPIYVFFKDEQIRSLQLSRNFEQMLGRPLAELLGKNMNELFPSDFASKMVEDDIRVIREGKEVVLEEEFNGRSYTTIKFPIHIGGKPSFLAGFSIDVTEQKQAAAKLLESEMKYRSLSESLKITEQRSRALIENAPDGIVMIDKTGRFTYASPPAIRMFGYSTTEIGFLNPDELTHPDDLPMVLETMGRLFQDPCCVPTIQYRFKHKNGNWFWIESTFSNLLETPGIESIVINFRNITDRKLAEDKLREREQQFRKLSRGIEQSPAAVIITDTAGCIEYVNPVFTTMTGYSLERVKGKVARILKPDRTSEEVHHRIWKTILNGKVWTGEYLSKKMNGQSYCESVSVAPILDPQGVITDFIITMEDISERKKMISELVEARKKAEESDHLKSTFLANMSHEIRTPMNAIVGFAEMLSDPSLSHEDRTRFAHIVQSRSDDLMHIINDLLEISRIESGNITVIKCEFSINEVLGDIGVVFNQRLERLKRANLTLHIEQALPDKLSVIESDIHIFKQVFSNLIENAIKYTHSGSIHCGYLPPVKNEITFYTRDTGIGISPENQAVIFEHFRQADIENRSQYSGTGLGLAICKGALANIGGKIWVESEPGKGSAFYFTLPYHHKEPVPDRDKSPQHNGMVNEKSGDHFLWPGKHILIVEDEPTNMEFLKIILGKTQVGITPAENALALRNHYQRLDQFDLVLLDVRLPDASGWDLAREIKAIVPGLPIIAQTAYAMSTDLQRSISAGCDSFISKPINKAKLLKMLSSYLG